MQAGSLRHRIDVIEPVIVQDPNTGIDKTEWHYKYRGIPAGFEPMSTRELHAAAQRQSQSSVKFKIRSGLNIDPQDMIVFNGRIWDIESPSHDSTLRIDDRIMAADKSSLQDIEITEPDDSNGSS